MTLNLLLSDKTEKIRAYDQVEFQSDLVISFIITFVHYQKDLEDVN